MKKIGDANTITADEARRIVLKIKKAKSSGDLENLFKPKAIAPTLRDFYYKYYKPYIYEHLKRPKDYDPVYEVSYFTSIRR